MRRATSARHSSGSAYRWFSSQCSLWRCWSCGSSRRPCIDQAKQLTLPHFPNPQLQPSPRESMARFYAEEMQRLNGTGWIDKAKGTVHIPIADCDAQDRRRRAFQAGRHRRRNSHEAPLRDPAAVVGARFDGSGAAARSRRASPTGRGWAISYRSTPCFATRPAAVRRCAICSAASRRSWPWFISTARTCAASCVPICSMRSPRPA